MSILPRVSTPNAEEAGTSATMPVPVLVVDDNAAKRMALRAVISPLGCDVVEADSGLAALRCLMVRDFAVILLDVRMPIMDGFETATAIRERPRSETTPIIFITAHQEGEIQEVDRFGAGAIDFMFAPVPAAELRAKVRAFGKIFSRASEQASRAEQVQASADHLRLLTDAAPIGIFQTDHENRYVYTNPRWSLITGIPSQEALGRAWETIIGAEQRASVESESGSLARSEVSQRFEFQLPDSASKIVMVTSRAIPSRGGGVEGWVGTLADVTAEAGAEETMSQGRAKADEASRLKSDFLANMSHEIRTPMNGVIGMTDLLLETDLDPDQRDYAQTVRNSGEALLTIINDILDFSKVEAGKLEVVDVAFDLRQIVDDVVDLLASQAQSKGVELVAVVQNSVPTLISGDPGRVRQVLTNLIGNAIKFTHVGEIVVRVSDVEPQSEDDANDPGDDARADGVIRFEVTDTGEGIEDEKLDLVFQPFVQADTSISRRYGGTGLGLAISSQLVSLMGGHYGLWSKLDVGSTFWFTIPLHVVTDQPAHPMPSPDPGLDGVTILVADDSAIQRAVLTDMLADWGMIVSSAESGPAALAKMLTAADEGRPFAVTLLDHAMPGMSGIELQAEIAADPRIDPRIVIMSGLGQSPEPGDAVPTRTRTSVSKPIHGEDLRTSLRVALGLARTDPDSGVEAPPRPTPDARREGLLLLAEDSAVNQKVAVAILSLAGYTVDTVSNGALAVEAAAARRYDAILMDCQMPEMSGYEATAAIRSQEGLDRHTPIIALTAGAMHEDRERAIAEGMDAYLSKPINKDTLLALVARCLSEATVVSPLPRVEPHDPVLDAAVVERLQRLGATAGVDLLAELIVLFLDEADERVAELREAFAQQDAGATTRSAHALRGASANLGANSLVDLSSRLERAGVSGDLAEGWAILEAIACELDRVRSTAGSFPASSSAS